MKLTKIAAQMHEFYHFKAGADRPAGHERRIKHRINSDGNREIVYTLFGKEIVHLVSLHDGTHELTLDYCGYHTVTTAKAMRQFLGNANISSVHVSTYLVTVLNFGITGVNSITIQLRGNLVPEPVYSDFRIKDQKLHFRMYDYEVIHYDLIDGYIVTPSYSGLPYLLEGAKNITKGFIKFSDNMPVRNHVLRARNPQARTARLMAAVLLGEVQLHAW